tara:strand:- start:196041 stop:196664 length:624 start_codon:yes stop_codon:yes gene_type:complete
MLIPFQVIVAFRMQEKPAYDDGNFYKPEDGSANFVDGTFSAEDFQKKTNEDDEDWSDIIALFGALHDDTASTDSAAWRENLEAVFEDEFLKYLAVNEIIQNWDTYGSMPHNYYLYNNPDTGQLTRVPWDNNEALQTDKQGGALALDFANMNDSGWPLIARIYADEVYRARYDTYQRKGPLFPGGQYRKNNRSLVVVTQIVLFVVDSQ